MGEDGISGKSIAAVQTLSEFTACPSADRDAGRVATAADVASLAGPSAMSALVAAGITGHDGMADVSTLADRGSAALANRTGSDCGGGEDVWKA